MKLVRKVQTCGYKIRHENVMYSMATIVKNTLYLKVAKRVPLKSSQHTPKIL